MRGKIAMVYFSKTLKIQEVESKCSIFAHISNLN